MSVLAMESTTNTAVGLRCVTPAATTRAPLLDLNPRARPPLPAHKPCHHTASGGYLSGRGFVRERDALALKYYTLYNERAFGGVLPRAYIRAPEMKNAGCADHLGLVWSKTLNTTAGTTQLIRVCFFCVSYTHPGGST